MDKQGMITEILQVNTVSIITNSEMRKENKKRMCSNEELFLNLVLLTEEELTKICNELYIKI
jgi:hypothetical protein